MQEPRESASSDESWKKSSNKLKKMVLDYNPECEGEGKPFSKFQIIDVDPPTSRR